MALAQGNQLTLFPAKSEPKRRKTKPKPAPQAATPAPHFPPVDPPNLAQDTSLWLVGQRSIAVQRGKRYVPASVKHPGKMFPDLAGAIIETYTQPGDWIVDCMAGIFTTGVEGAERGRNVIGVELVRHWQNVAYANAVRTAYRGAPGIMRVLQGDARALQQLLAEQVDATVMSPPYGEALEARSGRMDNRKERLQALIEDGKALRGNWHLGPGQRAALAPQYDADAGRHQVDAVLTSPPYADSINQSPAASDAEARRRRLEEAGHSDYKFGPNSIQAQTQQYDAVLSSPPYGDNIFVQRDLANMRAMEGRTDIPEAYDAALLSPPYGPTQTGRGMALTGINGDGRPPVERGIGATYDAAVFSPPYGQADQDGEKLAQRTSSQAVDEKGIGFRWKGFGDRHYAAHNQDAPRADAAIFSPAYGDIRQDGGDHQFGDGSAMDNYTGEARVQQRGRDQSNIGNKKYGAMKKALALVERLKAGETIPESEWPAQQYLEDMALVYWNCLQILKPGGLCILVLKDYRRDKKRVNLIGDTITLMEAVGFVLHDKALAMTSKVEADDKGSARVVAKVSPFVRVNARKPEKNGGPVLLPAGEEVLVFRKG